MHGIVVIGPRTHHVMARPGRAICTDTMLRKMTRSIFRSNRGRPMTMQRQRSQ
jgi:hypothetical protein